MPVLRAEHQQRVLVHGQPRLLHGGAQQRVVLRHPLEGLRQSQLALAGPHPADVVRGDGRTLVAQRRPGVVRPAGALRDEQAERAEVLDPGRAAGHGVVVALDRFEEDRVGPRRVGGGGSGAGGAGVGGGAGGGRGGGCGIVGGHAVHQSRPAAFPPGISGRPVRSRPAPRRRDLRGAPAAVRPGHFTAIVAQRLQAGRSCVRASWHPGAFTALPDVNGGRPRWAKRGG